MRLNVLVTTNVQGKCKQIRHFFLDQNEAAEILGHNNKKGGLYHSGHIEVTEESRA